MSQRMFIDLGEFPHGNKVKLPHTTLWSHSRLHTGSSFPFLKLSGELRNLIYSRCFYDTKGTSPNFGTPGTTKCLNPAAFDAPAVGSRSRKGCRHHDRSVRPRKKPVALLTTCARIYDEAVLYLYHVIHGKGVLGLNDVLGNLRPRTMDLIRHIHTEGYHSSQQWGRAFEPPLDTLHQLITRVRRLRYLECISTEYGWMSGKVRPSWEHGLVQCGGLLLVYKQNHNGADSIWPVEENHSWLSERAGAPEGVNPFCQDAEDLDIRLQEMRRQYFK